MELNIKRINMSGVAIDSLLLTFVRFITFGTNIIITMLLSRTLTLADYGTYSQGNLIISISTSFMVFGLTDAINYFYNKSDDIEEKKIYINTITGIQLIIGILGGVILFLLKNKIIVYFNNPQLSNMIIYITARPYLANSLALFQVLYISNGNAKLIAIRNLVLSIVQIILLGITLLFTKNVKNIFLIVLILDILQVLFFVLYFNSRYFKINPFNIKFKYISIILKYSIPMALYIVLNNFTRDMDKIIIANKTSIETVALFTNVSKALPFDILMVSFSTVLLPYITKYVSNNKDKEAQHLFCNYLQFGYITTWILATGAIISAPELIKFLYGEKYLPGLSIFVVYLLVDMVRFANFGILLTARGKTKILLIYSTISLFINLILNTILFDKFGTIGPALATLISLLIINISLLYHGSKIINIRFTKLLRIKDIKILIIELFFVGVLIAGFRSILLNFKINYFIILIFTYSLFVAIMFILNNKKIINLINEINTIKRLQ